jgi:hypothetical protein
VSLNRAIVRDATYTYIYFNTVIEVTFSLFVPDTICVVVYTTYIIYHSVNSYTVST